jgi:HK97 gp10 family phage protein
MAKKDQAGVEGFKEFAAKMHNLKAEVAGKIARKAVAKAARFVKEQAKMMPVIAPESYKATGKEADGKVGSVMVAPKNVHRGVIIKRMTKTPYSAHYIVTLRGKKQFGYAKRIGALIEYGTVKQPPRPFLKPALRDNQQQVKAIMEKSIRLDLRKSWAQP